MLIQTKATTSRVVGTFTTRAAARLAARTAMREMLADEKPAPEAKEAFPVEGAGGGLIMVFSLHPLTSPFSLRLSSFFPSFLSKDRMSHQGMGKWQCKWDSC